jgi:hypothetical protein
MMRIDHSVIRRFVLCCGEVMIATGLVFAGMLFFAAVRAVAQNSADHAPSDLHKLVTEAVYNELHSQKTDQSLWAYSETREEHGKAETLQAVETKDGEIDHLVAINGQPLTGQELERENRRIRRLITHPEELRKLRGKAASDANEERKLLKMLPDAFVYKYDGMQGDEIKLHFEPNPKFHAPDREARVFHHMDGEMYIDRRQKRLAEIDGKLTSRVKFGDGLLGHLDKGGTFSVKQRDVGGGHWEMTYLNVQMNGKALFFKTIAVRELENYSGFRRVPDGTTANRAAQFLNVHSGE